MLKPKRQVVSTQTVTAPVGGWNAISPLATMSPNEAVVIDNWFCLPTELKLRQGYTKWVNGISGNIQSLITWSNINGTTELFAAANNNGSVAIYDVTQFNLDHALLLTESGDNIVTQGGDYIATSKDLVAVASGLTDAHWHSVQTATSGGNFALAVNGADDLLLYNGTTWYKVNATSTPYAITGLATNQLADVLVHGRRVWFVQKNSLKCWYLATDSVAGALTEYDFGPVFAMGGSIAKIDTWTLDAGFGMDDYLIVITTAGEIAVYSGTNPASADTWKLNGIYYCGAPVGRNCTMKYGGDVLLLNKDGLVPLSQWLMSSRANVKTSITNKIQQRITDATSAYASNDGWQVVLYPPQNMLFVNIPISSTESQQYVMNTISGAWSRFTNVNAQCWGFVNEKLYFGEGGTVYLFWDGHNDDGSPIVSDLLPAFTAFGSSVQNKRMTMSRISMGTDNTFSYSNNISLDFNQVAEPNNPNFSPPPTAGIWNQAIFDTSTWGGGIVPFTRWQLAAGMGHYVSMRLKTSSDQADVRYYAIDYVFEGGNII